MIDERIVGATEELVRKVFNLTCSYEPSQFSVKKSNVEMEMSNGLISIKVKIPKDIIDSHLDGSCVTYMLNEDYIEPSESSEDVEPPKETNESTEELKEPTEDNMEHMGDTKEGESTRKSKRKVKRNGKAKDKKEE